MEKVINEANETLLALENERSKFDATLLNKVPFNGSWTAGQVAEHVVLSNAGFLKVINGPFMETDKPADLLVETIKKDFLNFK